MSKYLNDKCYLGALQLLRTLKLKIEIPESMIDGYTLIIDYLSSIIRRFIRDGIEIENSPSIKYITGSKLFNDIYYSNTIKLLRTLKLKIQIPEKFINCDTFFIDERSSIIGKFISDGIEIVTNPSLKYATVSKLLDGKYYLDTLKILRTLKLKIKIPKSMVVEGEKRSSIIERLISDDIEIENSP